MNNIATFGFWMQTLADLDLLNLELQNLTDNYEINPFEKLVKFKGNEDFIRLRIAHLEKVNDINPYIQILLMHFVILMLMPFIIYIHIKENFIPEQLEL